MAKSARKSSRASKANGGVSLKTVLCATDLSDCSQHALAQAAELAEAFDAKLVVVHAIEIWDDRYDFLMKDLERRLEEEANDKVEQELAHFGKSEKVPVEVVIRKGNASIEVLKTIRETKADLVVVGSHGKGALDRLILGSVAEKLLHLSPVSVLVARPSGKPDFTRILCGADISPTSATGLQWAVDLARRDRLDGISVVNCFEVPTGYLEAGMTYDIARSKLLDIHTAELDKLLAKYKGSKVDLERIVEEGPVAETIVKVADQKDADLIVIGTHGRSRLAAFFLGSVSVKIVRQSPISVLAVKPAKHRSTLLEIMER